MAQPAEFVVNPTGRLVVIVAIGRSAPSRPHQTLAGAGRRSGGEEPLLPLHPFDDHPYHQAITPMGSPVTSDSRFNDGYYFAFYRPGRHVFCGLRFHPNNNVVDGYGGAVAGGVQRGLRVSRALDLDRAAPAVGPVRIEVLEPMVSQRLICEDDQHGIGFDVVVTATGGPFFETPHVQYRYGRVLNHVLRYTQPGRAAGLVWIDGVEERVDDWFAARDHSWGIRQTMGPPLPVRGAGPAEADPRAMRLWVPFEVGDRAGFFHLHEAVDGTVLDCEGRVDLLGSAGDEGVGIVAVRHHLEYEPGTERLRAGELLLELDGADPLALTFEVTCEPAHPQGFGYSNGWCDGGNPGVWRGVRHAEGERFSVADAATVSGPDHTPVDKRLGGTEFTATVREPGGATGMAHVEHMRYRRRARNETSPGSADDG